MFRYQEKKRRAQGTRLGFKDRSLNPEHCLPLTVQSVAQAALRTRLRIDHHRGGVRSLLHDQVLEAVQVLEDQRESCGSRTSVSGPVPFGITEHWRESSWCPLVTWVSRVRKP